MNYKGIIAFILGLASIDSPAQENNSLTVAEGDLYLNFRNISFIRNNEYSNPVTEGYTLIGWFIQPELVYRPAQKVELRLGAHFTHVEVIELTGTIDVPTPDPVISHLASYQAWAHQTGVPFDATIERAAQLVSQQIARDGHFVITVRSGILIATGPRFP